MCSVVGMVGVESWDDFWELLAINGVLTKTKMMSTDTSVLVFKI